MMCAAMSGDAGAYKTLLEAVSPVLRASARRNLMRFGGTSSDAEDVVQETLLAIHLKRHTWDRAGRSAHGLPPLRATSSLMSCVDGDIALKSKSKTSTMCRTRRNVPIRSIAMSSTACWKT